MPLGIRELRQPTTGEHLQPNPAFVDKSHDTYDGFDPLSFALNELTADPAALKARQQLLAELGALLEDDRAKKVYEDAFGFGKLHNWLMTPVKDLKLSKGDSVIHTPRIIQYRRDRAVLTDPTDPAKGYVSNDFPVWELPEVFAKSQKRASTFSATYREAYPEVAQLIQRHVDQLASVHAGSIDPSNWTQITHTLRDAAPSIVFVDEPFSTTSSSYQEALILATLEWLTQRGHRVVIATHHHGVIAKLQHATAQKETTIDISFRHFGVEFDEESNIRFTHVLAEGPAPSHSLAVAKLLGGEALVRLLSSGTD